MRSDSQPVASLTINLFSLQRVKPKRLITAEDADESAASGKAAALVSPMPGRVVKVFVEPGQAVKKGDNLVSVESMKMEYFVKATRDGVVDTIKIGEGDTVAMKQELVTFEKPKVQEAA